MTFKNCYFSRWSQSDIRFYNRSPIYSTSRHVQTEASFCGAKRTAQQYINVTVCYVQVKPESINKTTLLREELGKPWKGHIKPGSKTYLLYINSALCISHLKFGNAILIYYLSHRGCNFTAKTCVFVILLWLMCLTCIDT